MVKRHDLLRPFDDFLPLAGPKRVVLRQAGSDYQRYIRYKTHAFSLMAFAIRNWLFQTDTCVIACKWQLKAWSKWHKVSWAIKISSKCFLVIDLGRDVCRSVASHCAHHCKPTSCLLESCKKSSCAEIKRKIYCFKYRTHLSKWRRGKTLAKIIRLNVLVWIFSILRRFKRNYFNLSWTLKGLTASLTILLKVNTRKSFLIQGKDCTKSWRQACKRLMNYLITNFPIFVFLIISWFRFWY